MRKVRWGSILLGLMMLLTLLTVTAFAAETTVAATDNAAANGQALVDAVSQASEGDTIVISAGTYDLPKNTYVRFYWIGSLAMGDFCAEKTAATMGAPLVRKMQKMGLKFSPNTITLS